MAETKQFKTGAVALALVAIGAVAGIYVLATKPDIQPTPTAAPPPAPVVAAPPPIAPPEFDVVRVDPQGNTVIAGRAAPGAVVTVKTGNVIIGKVTADASGAFALAPDAPLPPGAQELTLAETLPGGKTITGESSASVDVPANNTAPLAVLSSPTGSKVLSGQGPAAGTLGIGTVDYDANGHAIFSGTAKPGDTITLSLGKTQIGQATAGPDGRWTFSAKVPQNDGTLTVTDGTLPPATAPFALETLPDALAEGHVVIVPGQNLWLIAHHVYGHGIMYTLIYSANQSQIHDPNLIFPGQAFALPKPKT